MKKKCNQCNVVKNIENFHKGTAKFKRKSICKMCIADNYKAKRWVLKSNYQKVTYNSKKCRCCDKLFKPMRKDNIFCSRYCSDKYSKNLRKKEINAYYKNKYHSDIQRRLSACLRSRLNKALKGSYRYGSAVRDLGCTPKQLIDHLESQFKSGMSWDNYGLYGWHIDHIKPLADFDLSDSEQLRKACHYTNLQPLWATDNLSKGSNYEQVR